MTALPPDARRLRAILAFIEDRIAENETVAVYLRLQRDAVRAALAEVEGGAPSRQPRPTPGPGRRSAAPPPFTPNLGAGRPRAFAVQQKRTPDGPEPAVIHTDDCTMIEGTAHPIRPHEARVALTDPHIEPCAFCRPDSELGILE
ncbi:DUF6233 domain-containing protein [Streptomyces sp. NPDC098781]|uniref:DUF6233 domain-containing protein n=1 Tax=Streptomyces sp. NPDC098781 TaxID=3366097 RepID=UPI0037F5E5B4